MATASESTGDLSLGVRQDVASKLRLLGVLPLAFFIAQLSFYWRTGGMENMLWMCNVANLALAARSFRLKAGRVGPVGAIGCCLPCGPLELGPVSRNAKRETRNAKRETTLPQFDGTVFSHTGSRAVENVKDTSIQKAERKKDWALTQGAFRGLLAWLDEGRDSSGENYLETRRRLVSYFDRKSCLPPDELADETLNRVARRLEEEGSITGATPAQYCYIVAKYVFLEYQRRTDRGQVSLDELSNPRHPASSPAELSALSEAAESRENRLDCLERCLQNLEPDNRDLIIQYYRGEQRAKIDNRRALAARLGITTNALGIRACRVRDKLEACVSKCAER